MNVRKGRQDEVNLLTGSAAHMQQKKLHRIEIVVCQEGEELGLKSTLLELEKHCSPVVEGILVKQKMIRIQRDGTRNNLHRDCPILDRQRAIVQVQGKPIDHHRGSVARQMNSLLCKVLRMRIAQKQYLQTEREQEPTAEGWSNWNSLDVLLPLKYDRVGSVFLLILLQTRRIHVIGMAVLYSNRYGVECAAGKQKGTRNGSIHRVTESHKLRQCIPLSSIQMHHFDAVLWPF